MNLAAPSLRILLTGTNGQVGKAIQHRLTLINTQLGYEKFKLITPRREDLDLNALTKIRDTILENQPQLIINPAAYTAVDHAETDIDTLNNVNHRAVHILAQTAQELGIGFIHFSTDYVFDGNKKDQLNHKIAYQENDMCLPINRYGMSKLAGERAIQQSACKHLILRTSWVYADTGKNFLLTMLRLAQEKKTLHIVNDQWGTPTSADFLAQKIELVLNAIIEQDNDAHWWKMHQGIYHLTPEGYTTWQGFAKLIFQLAYTLRLIPQEPELKGIPSSEYPLPAKRPMNSCLDKSKWKQHFETQALSSWETETAACLKKIAAQTIKNNPSNLS